MSTLAIGDVHGCHTALATLLRTVAPTPADRIVFVGDYIDRGPDSRAVMELLLTQAEVLSCVFLRGNHEVMVLEARDDPTKASLWQSYGGFETLHSYGAPYRADWASAIPETHWQFWERTVRFFENATTIFVHACLDPDLDLPEQPDWLTYWEFFERIQPHKSGKKIICGHTPNRLGVIRDVGFAACIDTGPGVGGWLSCLDTESGRYWQANEKGVTRKGCLDWRVGGA